MHSTKQEVNLIIAAAQNGSTSNKTSIENESSTGHSISGKGLPIQRIHQLADLL